MGYIADNTPQNRFGKKRVWFLVSIVPIALSFIIIWFPTGIESQAGKFIFYTIAYIIFFTVSTVSYIPYAALSAEITKDFTERNKLNGSRLMFSFIATLAQVIHLQKQMKYVSYQKRSWSACALPAPHTGWGRTNTDATCFPESSTEAGSRWGWGVP